LSCTALATCTAVGGFTNPFGPLLGLIARYS
jgi:hypothetical protein